MPEGLPIVALASVGGTITMTPGDSGGVQPTLTAADLAASVPGLSEVCEIRVDTLASIPSPSFPITRFWDVAEWGREQVDQGASGVMLAQGTDTIEESSFLLDLYWELPHPFIVTGAMRAPRQVSADGPANLLTAAVVASSGALRDQGVLVVLDQTAHAARVVRKTHSWAVSTFQSPGFGPVGFVIEGRLRARPMPRPAVRIAAPLSDPYVPLLETFVGDDGTTLRAVLDAGADGVVLGAFGVGHLPARVARVVAEAAADVPIVVASRTGSGGTLRETYGYEGSEIDLGRKGAILAGALDPRKARTLLWAATAAGRPAADVPGLFAAFDD
ncbi:asparaginase [Propionicicella superfundia]|uniref:asparaginase n=1 Tax=Propionicicella superfundia TaxID=348582 RepID=UPI0003FE6024|nr:asparaginase [Propionicicella superfundia]